MSKIDELISKQEVVSKTLTDVIIHPDTKKGAELDKILACRRFVRGFINDLKTLKP